MKWQLVVLGSSFPIFGLKTLASAGHPHKCMYLREGSLPVHSSYSVVGMLTVKIRQPSHEFTFGIGMTFVSYPLVLTPVV
jgi:hypothetical protein